MNSIIQRRSIRKYTDQKLTRDQVNEIIKAGMYAPSAGNSQPWEFIVVDDKNIFSEIMKIHKYSRMLQTASHAVIICANLDRELFKGYFPQDCGACAQNMLLQTQEMGLGGVWLGIYPEKDRIEAFTNIFSLPENIIPFGVIVLGYPNENKKIPERFDESRIYNNKYNQK